MQPVTVSSHYSQPADWEAKHAPDGPFSKLLTEQAQDCCAAKAAQEKRECEFDCASSKTKETLLKNKIIINQ